MYKMYMMIFIMMLGIGSVGAEESFSEEAAICLPEEPVTCVGAYDDEEDDDLDGESLDLGVPFELDDDEDMAVSP